MGKLLSHSVVATIPRGTNTITVSDVPVTGYLRGVSVVAGDFSGSATYTIEIADKNGMVVYSKGSLTRSSTTTNWADLYGGSFAVSVLNIPMAGPIDVTITTSVVQNDSDVSSTVHLYYDQ